MYVETVMRRYRANKLQWFRILHHHTRSTQFQQSNIMANPHNSQNGEHSNVYYNCTVYANTEERESSTLNSDNHESIYFRLMVWLDSFIKRFPLHKIEYNWFKQYVSLRQTVRLRQPPWHSFQWFSQSHKS